MPEQRLAVRTDFPMRALAIWLLVGVAAALSHLPADAVFSGYATLPDWTIQPLWPFPRRSWARPMVPWGDPGVAILFGLAALAMLRWRRRLQAVSVATLLLVGAYILIRGMFPA